LGVGDRVIFTGYVPEEEKIELYRAADAFVMPSRAEGFGIVLLEALACGVPVVGSKIDAGRELLRDGKWGVVVDPDDLNDIENGIYKALTEPVRPDISELAIYSFENYERALHAILDKCVS
jgi:glycosyltransferase involved in cell wall biosynthesis